jgi:glyceraldehyde 3-phosphate dehydrogenase
METAQLLEEPASNVSIVDLTCHLEKPAKYDDIHTVVKQASKGALKDILGYTEATLRTTLSPATSTATPTLPLSMLGLALLSMTTL